MIMMMTTTHLPFDLITDILSRLPAKTVVRFKIICKSWRNLIDDYDFVNYHLEQSLANKTNLHYVVWTPKLYLQEYDHLDEPLEQNCPVLYSADFESLDNPVELRHPYKDCKTPVLVIGSCRGLILLHGVDAGHLLLYNPTTQTYNVLPLLLVYQPTMSIALFDYGFGFDHVSRDYKCVRIFQCLYQEIWCPLCEVMVYSLRTNCWKRVVDVPCYFRSGGWSNGVFVNETCHWIGTDSHDMYKHIVAFSFTDETFSCLPLPNALLNYHFEQFHGLHMDMLDGCLSLLANRYPHCDLWVMKEYGVAGSWTRMFTFETDYTINLDRPIGYSSDKKKLVLKTSLFRLLCVDLETMEYTDVTFADWDRGLDPHVYVENLLMLDYAEFIDDSHVKRGKRKNKRRRKRRRRKNKN